MNILWHALGGLCAAALILVTALSPSVAPVQAETCTELLTDGSFETGANWQLGPSPVMPQYVTYTKHSGNRSLSLGITSGANVESFSSARQTVTIPAASPQVLLSFWFYAMADSPATTDYMEVVLLDATGTAILNKPWSSHNDSRVWNQLTFDLTSWRGQTVQLYFNVYNDGLGGRAAMFLDDVSLASCTSSGTATPTGTAATATSSPAPNTPTPSPTPGCVDVVVDGKFNNGLANWQVVGDSAGAAPVSSPARSAPYALKLGSLDQNLSGLATVRQLVSIPTGYPQITLEAWVYTQTQAGAGADFQRIALLDSAGGLLFMPWQRQEDNPAWQPLTYNVSAFAGQTVFVSFSVNNDGIGGRTAMHVDDVRLIACVPGAAATATPTATHTPATPVSGTPTSTATPVPPGCTKITENGGFETGSHPWQIGVSTLLAHLVTEPVGSGSYVMQMGSQTENRDTYSSIRQTVTAAWGRPRVVVSFWAYTWAEELSGNDRQQFILLGPGDAVWAKPWSVLESDDAWRQHIFDIAGVAGQTFSLYFNAYNDGVGGRTALFLDEVHAWACTWGAYPSVEELGGSPPGPLPVVTVPGPGAVMTLAPTDARPSLAGATAGTPSADLTRTSLIATPQSFVGTRVEPETTDSSSTPGVAPSTSAGMLARLLNWLRNAVKDLPPAWPWIIGVIVALLAFILLRARPRQ